MQKMTLSESKNGEHEGCSPAEEENASRTKAVLKDQDIRRKTCLTESGPGRSGYDIED